MNATTRRIATALNATLVTGVLMATALPAAHASGGGTRVTNNGTCSGATVWKLKAKPDNSRIEVEGEIDSNRNGQVWTWRIKQNGTVAARGQGTTKAPSGSFSVNRRLDNLAGSDTFVLRAVNTASGEVCRGSVTL
ncbi:MAG: hypothetical protein KDB63_21980 [Nocardioidaceae bacterium]|nr:hypothetical protein [Nocardioidaceae bacterium]